MEDKALKVFKAKLEKAGKSPRTYSTYLWHLDNFFRAVGMTPSQFLEAAKQRKIDVAEQINKATDEMIAAGLKRAYVKLTVCAVKKFVKVTNGKTIDAFSEVALDEIGRDAKLKETPLEVDHIREALKACRTKRDKALVSVATASGLREAELAGLNVGDVVEEKDRVIIPVRDEIAKGHRGYLSFLTPEAHEFLKDYLDERKKRGEKLGPDSPLFLPIPNPLTGEPRTGRLNYHTIGQAFREIFRRAGLIPPEQHGSRRVRYPIRPHGLRKFTRRAYLKSGVELETAERLLGHNLGSLSQVYTPQSVDELWEAYRRAIPRLTIEKQPDATPMVTNQEIEVIKAILREQGQPELADKLRIEAPDAQLLLQGLAFLRAQATLGRSLSLFIDNKGVFKYPIPKPEEPRPLTEREQAEASKAIEEILKLKP